MLLSAASAWPSATRAALFLLSFFLLILSLSYFYLGNQEEKGYSYYFVSLCETMEA